MTDEEKEDNLMGENKPSENKTRPRRYSLYDQINVNEKWLDVFIVGMIVLLLLVMFFAMR